MSVISPSPSKVTTSSARRAYLEVLQMHLDILDAAADLLRVDEDGGLGEASTQQVGALVARHRSPGIQIEFIRFSVALGHQTSLSSML